MTGRLSPSRRAPRLPTALAAVATVSALALALAGPAPASAAVTIGETFPPAGENCSPTPRIQTGSPGDRYIVPFAGVITSWSYRAGSGSQYPIRFLVARQAGVDTFTWVAKSEYVVPTADTLNTYPVRIVVQPGDVIGIFAAPPSVYICARSAPGYSIHRRATFGDPVVGETEPLVSQPNIQLDLSAELDPYRCKDRNATLGGTAGDDSLTGTNSDDAIAALAGDDVVGAAGGEDCLAGDAGDDVLRGGAGDDLGVGGDGNDKLRGQNGADRLSGDADRDKVNGGNGKDVLKGGPGKDKLKGAGAKDKVKAGGGADRVGAQDGKRDKVNCGGGRDRAVVDPVDKVKRCERVKVVDRG